MRNAGGALSGYGQLIQNATGSPEADLGQIENIMREEVFHSTLDWQSREEFAAGARKAFARLREDGEVYDLERACRFAMLRKMQAEEALKHEDTPGKHARMVRAEAKYQKAVQRLFRRLDGREDT